MRVTGRLVRDWLKKLWKDSSVRFAWRVGEGMGSGGGGRRSGKGRVEDVQVFHSTYFLGRVVCEGKGYGPVEGVQLR